MMTCGKNSAAAVKMGRQPRDRDQRYAHGLAHTADVARAPVLAHEDGPAG